MIPLHNRMLYNLYGSFSKSLSDALDPSELASPTWSEDYPGMLEAFVAMVLGLDQNP